MIPKNADELYGALLRVLWTRLYGDLTEGARRKRLTEHDIGQIERRVLADLQNAPDFTADFPDFDARQVQANVVKEIEQFLAVTRTARVKKIANEH